jgi:hypothetical protein
MTQFRLTSFVPVFRNAVALLLASQPKLRQKGKDHGGIVNVLFSSSIEWQLLLVIAAP